MSDIYSPGVIMDSIIATRLWGMIVLHEKDAAYLIDEGRKRVDIPKYSTDPAESQRIIAYMSSQGYIMRVRRSTEENADKMVAFVREEKRSYTFTKHAELPMAICLAALAALEGSNIKIKKAP